MYSSAFEFTNYAGPLENCLLKPNRSNQSTGKRQTAAKSRLKPATQNVQLKMSFNRSTKFKRSIESAASSNGPSANTSHDCASRGASPCVARCHCTAQTVSNKHNLKPIKLTKCKMLILTVIYSLLCTSGVAGQFFRPAPLSNNIGSSSFESPNEINSIELFVHENARNHHTIDYEIVDGLNPPLVIRRSDVFVLGLKFRKPYDPRRDKVRLEFMFGKSFWFFFAFNRKLFLEGDKDWVLVVTRSTTETKVSSFDFHFSFTNHIQRESVILKTLSLKVAPNFVTQSIVYRMKHSDWTSTMFEVLNLDSNFKVIPIMARALCNR